MAMLRPEAVDKALGAGAYQRWQTIQDAFIEEQTRAFANAERFYFVWAASLKKQVSDDLLFAETIDKDYLTYLDRACAGKATAADGEKILDVFVLAISVLTLVNDVLDDIWGLGFVALFTALSGAGVNVEAGKLRALLKKLQSALEKAKREVKEAWVQTGIDAAIGAVLLCSGPIGWLGLGAFAVTQMVVDTYLGPATSNAATWGNRGATTLGAVTSASEQYLELSSKTKTITKHGGKGILVIGFLFDANELLVGYNNVDNIKRVMAEVKTEHEKLLAKLSHYRATLRFINQKMEELRMRIEKRGDGWTAQTRETLEFEMRRTGYRPKV